jgi:hypothetical protein
MEKYLMRWLRRFKSSQPTHFVFGLKSGMRIGVIKLKYKSILWYLSVEP